MAELTEQQIEQASKASRLAYDESTEVDCIGDSLRAAAPYLQLPWEPPMSGEINAIFDTMRHVDFSTFAVVCEFVRRRNAAFQPKPVDPRREKIIAALDKQYLNGESSKIADAILAALDEVK
jgi:hypothetical protein